MYLVTVRLSVCLYRGGWEGSDARCGSIGTETKRGYSMKVMNKMLLTVEKLGPRILQEMAIVTGPA
jgi:hypothetical protein